MAENYAQTTSNLCECRPVAVDETGGLESVAAVEQERRAELD